MNATDLYKYIIQNRIEAEILLLKVETPTVEAAALALGVLPEQIIKSVLFLADKEPVVVIASGLARLDQKGLADYLGVSRRRVKIAGPEAVLAHTGYVAGSVPPFAYIQPIRTVVETAVLHQPGFIYGGGGDINALLKLTVGELRRVVGEETAALSVTRDP
ncbi:MAG TPA: YbaK/EbsC family protein [Chloroflexota bacterium]|nr:YbaK/EbsC family protein [Chloroflexota bacterium]HUM67624.1 YbaK/EbsC family protein [Chloroflexota bacterium]